MLTSLVLKPWTAGPGMHQTTLGRCRCPSLVLLRPVRVGRTDTATLELAACMALLLYPVRDHARLASVGVHCTAAAVLCFMQSVPPSSDLCCPLQNPSGSGPLQQRTLADIILQKIQDKQRQQGLPSTSG